MLRDEYRIREVTRVRADDLETLAARMVLFEDTVWPTDASEWLEDFYTEEVVPVLTPLTLDPSRPFPRTLNKSLNFIVRLKGRDAFGRKRHRAVVQAPRSLPRIIQLPEHLVEPGADAYVFLSSIIHAHASDLFPGMKAEGCYQFRVTRNSNLYVDD